MFQFAAVVCVIAVAASNPVKQEAPVGWQFKETIFGPGSSADGDRNSVLEPRRWDGGILYLFDEELSDKCRMTIENLMDSEIGRSCLKFDEAYPGIDREHIYIQYGDGYSAHIGNSGAKKQLVTIPNNDTLCNYRAPLLHLLLHVVGFYDEHVRIDRDDYITIHWENIHSNNHGSFEKLDDKKAVTYDGFDFDTLMLLDQNFNSKSKDLKSWTPKDSSVNITPFLRKWKLSESDFFRINKMYKCEEQ